MTTITAPAPRGGPEEAVRALREGASAALASGHRLYDHLERLAHEGRRIDARTRAGLDADPRALLTTAGAVRALLDELSEHVAGVEEALDAMPVALLRGDAAEAPERAPLPEDPGGEVRAAG